MDVKIVLLLPLLIGLSMEFEHTNPQLGPNHQLYEESHLDVFAEILTHKYAKDGKLKLTGFTSLWANLLGEGNYTSTHPQLDSLCQETLGQSPVCQLANKVLMIFLFSYLFQIYFIVALL